MSDYREEIGDFLYLLSEKLDEELYEDFLSLCDADFHYQVSAFSPELGKEMVWLDHDYKEIRNLMLLIHQHVRMKEISLEISAWCALELLRRTAMRFARRLWSCTPTSTEPPSYLQ